MRRTRKNRRTPAIAAVAGAVLALTATPALADGSSGHSLVRDELVGSMPAPASPTIAGIRPGGAPWVNGPSTVRVRSDGRVAVTIAGLVIPPPVGTGVNPFTEVVATLVCDGVVRVSTAPFRLSTTGDGSTSTTIAGTRHCEDPAVLIQPTANQAVYIAATQGHHDDD